jgi:hypothetical protein
MEGMKARLDGAAAALADGPRRAAWELRRGGRGLRRRIGAAGLLLLAGLAASGLALWAQQRELQALAQLRQQWLVQQAQPVARPVDTRALDGRARLAEFDAYLPGHGEIPATVGALFNLAQQEGLTIARGDYKAQPDAAGGFLRYRMTLPVQGDAAAIRRFMLAALRGHKTLALESVQFKRERAATAEVEARIQWVLFSRMPLPGSGMLAVAAPAGARP